MDRNIVRRRAPHQRATRAVAHEQQAQNEGGGPGQGGTNGVFSGSSKVHRALFAVDDGWKGDKEGCAEHEETIKRQRAHIQSLGEQIEQRRAYIDKLSERFNALWVRFDAREGEVVNLQRVTRRQRATIEEQRDSILQMGQKFVFEVEQHEEQLAAQDELATPLSASAVAELQHTIKNQQAMLEMQIRNNQALQHHFTSEAEQHEEQQGEQQAEQLAAQDEAATPPSASGFAELQKTMRWQQGMLEWQSRYNLALERCFTLQAVQQAEQLAAHDATTASPSASASASDYAMTNPTPTASSHTKLQRHKEKKKRRRRRAADAVKSARDQQRIAEHESSIRSLKDELLIHVQRDEVRDAHLGILAEIVELQRNKIEVLEGQEIDDIARPMSRSQRTPYKTMSAMARLAALMEDGVSGRQ